jgi:ABC-type glycerol-3-phosphate transport system substrate-binding protein
VCLLLALSVAVVASAKTPIRMVTYGEADTLAIFRQIAEVFNQSNPDYDLQVEVYPYGEYPTKITIMLASGVYPDLFLTWAQYKPSWAEQGLLLDIEPLWQKSQIAQRARLYPFAMEAAKYKGRLYGVPYDFSSIVWAMNLDALAEAGLPEPPYSWDVDMLKQYALKLNKPSEGRYGVKLGAAGGITNWQWCANYTGQGWVSDDLQQVNVENPKNIEMLEFWQDIAWAYDAAYVSGKPTVKNEFQGGYAIWWSWAHWGARHEVSPFEWTFTTYPRGPAGQDSFAHGHLWTIPAMVPRPELGWKVLEWMLSLEGQRAVVEINFRQPLSPNNDLWNRYYSNLSSQNRERVQKAVMENIYGKNLIRTMNYWPTWPDVERAMNAHLANVFNRRQSPTNEMAAAAKEIRAILNLK